MTATNICSNFGGFRCGPTPLKMDSFDTFFILKWAYLVNSAAKQFSTHIRYSFTPTDRSMKILLLSPPPPPPLPTI